VAVTRNLARVSDALLSECRVSVSELDRVCSFQTLDSNDYLDLDWAPRLLREIAITVNVPARLVVALDRAMGGEGEVNPAYRDWPESVWEHPVSSLKSTDVREIDMSLRALAQLGPVNERSVDDVVERLPHHEVPERTHIYLRRHFSALCDFYRGAAARQLGIIIWQD